MLLKSPRTFTASKTRNSKSLALWREPSRKSLGNSVSYLVLRLFKITSLTCLPFLVPEKRNDSVETITIEGDEERYKLEEANDVDNAKLVINPAKLSDRGTYTCVGTNDYMVGLPPATSATFLRVKDKLAALWPFLGICAEVFLLCAIILIYEKRRNKTDLDDSDTDQSPDQWVCSKFHR